MNPIRPNQTLIRWLAQEALPPYTYVPGRTPHPESHPEGHSFGKARQRISPIDRTDWRACRTYLRGLDLFNAGFYWECHVEFEALWLAEGRKGIIADFLKALIHLAASGVKEYEGRPEGVASHAKRATELLKLVQKQHGSGAAVLGFSVSELIGKSQAIAENGWPTSVLSLVPTDAAR
jgi:hypothetical protein